MGEEGLFQKRIASWIEYINEMPELHPLSAKEKGDLEGIVWDAKKEFFESIGNFEYKEPYNYELPYLKIKYEEASKKLLLVISTLIKWFGSDGENK